MAHKKTFAVFRNEDFLQKARITRPLRKAAIGQDNTHVIMATRDDVKDAVVALLGSFSSPSTLQILIDFSDEAEKVGVVLR